MENRDTLSIVYSIKERVLFSFWKYFFQMSGIWVNDFEIEHTDMEQVPATSPCLYILGTDDGDKKLLLKENIPDGIYVIQDNAAFAEFLPRPDIFLLEWGKKEGFIAALECLFRDREVLIELLDIYMSRNLWGMAWIFHEFPEKRRGSWKAWMEKLSFSAQNDLRQVRALDTFYIEYMDLYLSYIRQGLAMKADFGASKWWKGILQKGIDFAYDYDWSLSLCDLLIRISNMNVVTRKYSFEFFDYILKREPSARVYYDQGYEFEDVMGDRERALLCYRKSYKCNSCYYRAAYKLGVYMERREQWEEALKLYKEVEYTLEYINRDNVNISIREIEYEYKVMKRLSRLCTKAVDGEEMTSKYLDRIKVLYERVMDGRCFQRIIDCMFVDQSEKVRNEMSEYIAFSIGRRFDKKYIE